MNNYYETEPDWEAEARKIGKQMRDVLNAIRHELVMHDEYSALERFDAVVRSSGIVMAVSALGDAESKAFADPAHPWRAENQREPFRAELAASLRDMDPEITEEQVAQTLAALDRVTEEAVRRLRGGPS